MGHLLAGLLPPPRASPARMSEPYLADVMDRIVYVFCVPFSMNNTTTFSYIKMQLLPFLMYKIGRVITLPLQCERKKREDHV